MSTDGGSGGSTKGEKKERERTPSGLNQSANQTASLGQASAANTKTGGTPESLVSSGEDGKSLVSTARASSAYTPAAPIAVSDPRSLEGGGGGGSVPTSVTQAPTANAPAYTDVTPGRSDTSAVLAAQFKGPQDRGPARSNNFLSMVGGAGGLGRKTNAAKRSLIGGV